MTQLRVANDPSGGLMKAEEVIELLQLAKHPEGGWFKETYRSRETVSSSALPERYPGSRNFSTSIYYLITETGFAAIHKVASDEVFHFHLGDPAILSIISPAGELTEICLGPGIQDGHVLQAVVARDPWQGLDLKPGGNWALLGATVAPGFDFGDFYLPGADEMLKLYPQHDATIHRLTRVSTV
jgi:predicted cupin superfamily sugar epimerase